MNRRDILKNLGIASLGIPFLPGQMLAGEKTSKNKYISAGDLPQVKITRVRSIATCPEGIELIVVKVETDQPGLYGIGCATFRQRAYPVIAAVDKYLDDFCRGRSVHNIEDNWQSVYQSSYWRNGPVLNNALSGLDQALWDIKGKLANMPVYQLLGGKCRFAVDTYTHSSGKTPEEAADSVLASMEKGFRHIRIQLGGYGSTHLSEAVDFKNAGFGMPDDNVMDPVAYMQGTVKMFEKVREKAGEKIELLHDVHERVQPMDVINLVKKLEPCRPFFIEDPFSPENNSWFKLLRQQTSVPLAMGELFNNPHEWVEPMTDRWFDYIRIHISQIGGITPAMKVARLGEWFNIKTAWHGPGDVSPVGHAANAHIDLAVWNFGIQEAVDFSPLLQEIFPGAPAMKNGYMYVNEAPGLGVDIDEKLAKKYPLPDKFDFNWMQLRKRDGTVIRP
jgi:mannonate dehydratase